MATPATLRARVAAAQRTDPAQVEDGVLPRAATVVAVLVALLGVGLTGAAPGGEAVVAAVLVVVGNVVSHRRRRADNRLLKGAIAVVVLVVLARFLEQAGTAQTFDDTRVPLASLFLGVQTLHAFDLPRTRDLTFTVAASMALVALASASARSVVFVVVVTAWLAIAGASLWLLRLGENHRRAGGVLTRDALLAGGSGGGAPRRVRPASLVTLLLATLLLFLAVPRPEVGDTLTLPFQLRAQGLPSPGGVTNPGLPASDPGDDPDAAFDPVAYFGLADTVDIRTTGELGDELVLRVRSSRPRLLRGMVFDHYEDNRWTRTATEPEPSQGLPIALADQPGQRADLTQTIEVVTATPNLVFSAAAPRSLYHAGRSARQWADGTVTVAATQEPGTVYSVISSVPVADPAVLDAARGPTPDEVAATYLQVPGLSERTRALSAALVDPAATNHRNAQAVMAWLGENVAYSLDLDDHPPDQDAVDTLLFERRLGWCEPISAAMVLLLREGGVPARWVTGFQPGDFDVLTGWWEVRALHAHAWVEVWVPGHGWISFDPTGAVPNADGPATTDVDVPLLVVLRRALAWLQGLTAAGRAGLVALAAAAAVLLVAWRRRRVATAPLATLPVTWEVWETPTDLAGRLAAERGVAREPLDVLVRTHHAPLLDVEPPPGPVVREARAEVRRMLRGR